MRRQLETKHIVTLRALVGAVGEAQLDGWWESSFFIPSSLAFLSPAFPRTLVLSQVVGVTTAAAAVHDDRVGVGKGVSHLFRLPEDLERSCHEALHDAELISELAELLASPSESLSRFADGQPQEPRDPGPIRFGAVAALEDDSVWLRVAAVYRDSFANGTETFPFFSG